MNKPLIAAALLGIGLVTTCGSASAAPPAPGSPEDLCNYLTAHPHSNGDHWLKERWAKGDTKEKTTGVVYEANKICPAELKRILGDDNQASRR
jgi:hypothetical protein